MTKEEIAEKYAKIFVSNDDKDYAVNKIISGLNSLKNSDESEISLQTKKEILRIIQEFLKGIRKFKYQDGGTFLIVEKQDNAKFLAMVSNITSQLNDTDKDDE